LTATPTKQYNPAIADIQSPTVEPFLNLTEGFHTASPESGSGLKDLKINIATFSLFIKSKSSA
jgi:hypothetical protein